MDASSECLLYRPECPHNAESWAPNKIEQLKMFFETADFGYVKERRSELEHYCHPNNSSSSSELKCTKFLRYCTGRNLFLDLRRLDRVPEPIRYREDVLQPGDIGGWDCTLDRAKLSSQGEHKSPLMSWFAEMSNFRVLESSSNDKEEQCDITIDKPTFIMKLDATINMYHHFCDFLNLYISLHLASDSAFMRDNQVILWDSIPYRSNFALIWTAFTRNPIQTLSDFRGKRVCFSGAVTFPLLPRMIFGLYYNMPLVPGCQGSGLFRAFNRHLLLHLNTSTSEDLVAHEEEPESIQVTFISRTTKHRRVLNQDQLVDGLRAAVKLHKSYNAQVSLVDFNHWMPFDEQLAITSRSDVLIGMHGAGLTHTLLQPDYGVLFELYNCMDTECYRDLARLRGTHYMTWADESKMEVAEEERGEQEADKAALGAAHAKFVNYRFDVQEFVRLSLEAIEEAVVRRRRFKAEYKSKWWHTSDDTHNFNEPKTHKIEL